MERLITDFGIPKTQIPLSLFSQYGAIEVQIGRSWKIIVHGSHVHPDVKPSEKNKLSHKEIPFSSEGETLLDALNALSELKEKCSVQKGNACGRGCPHYLEF